MQNKQEIKSNKNLLSVLKVVAEAYEEVSVLRMKRVRDSVLFTRDFLSHLSDVFTTIKKSEKESKQVGKLQIKNEIKNGKKVSVLFSSNGKLYGEIVNKVYRLFIKTIELEETEVVIVGKTGKEFYDEYEKKKPFKYFALPDASVTSTDLKDLVLLLKNYEYVDVFYGRFEGFLTQNAVFSNITGEVGEQGVTGNVVAQAYIFEPTLEQLVNFFETQIFVSLLKQTANEAELARYASRIRAMETALENIASSRKNLYIEERKLHRQIENKKQLSLMSGISVWSK